MTLVWPIYCFSHVRKISQTKVRSFLLIWSYYVYNYLFEKYMILFFIREFKHSISKPSSKYCAVMLLVIMHFSITVMSKYSEAIFEFLLYKFFIRFKKITVTVSDRYGCFQVLEIKVAYMSWYNIYSQWRG